MARKKAKKRAPSRSKGKAVRRRPAGNSVAPLPGMSAEATLLLVEQVRSRVDQFHLRIDSLCGRLDAFSNRQEARERLDDLRISSLEAQLQQLPNIIERSLRAVLSESND